MATAAAASASAADCGVGAAATSCFTGAAAGAAGIAGVAGIAGAAMLTGQLSPTPKGVSEKLRASVDSSSSVDPAARVISVPAMRSDEHTSELQSLMRISYAVFCLKKKKTQ